MIMGDLPALFSMETIPKEFAAILGSGHDQIDKNYVLSIQKPIKRDIPLKLN